MALRTWSAIRSLRRGFHLASTMRQREDDCTHESLQKLSRHSFWKDRYENQLETFDWFLDPEEVSDVITDIVQRQHARSDGSPLRILDVGCGVSGLPASILSQVSHPMEYHCMDFVAVAVDFQRRNCQHARKGNRLSKYFGTVGNVTALPYKGSLFNVIIDKGTMDALMKDRINMDMWVFKMAAECHRAMVPQGHFVQVSDEDPDFRCPLLEEAFQSCDPNAVITFRVHGTDSGMEYFSYHYTKS